MSCWLLYILFMLLATWARSETSPCDELQAKFHTCDCKKIEWSVFAEQVRTVMQLDPTAHYSGDFSEVTNDGFSNLAGLSKWAIEMEIAAGDLSVTTWEFGETSINSSCLPGLATAFVIQFVYAANFMDNEWVHHPGAHKKQVKDLSAILAPLSLNQVCIESTAWIFVLEDAMRNIMTHQPGQQFFWRRFAVERSRLIGVERYGRVDAKLHGFEASPCAAHESQIDAYCHDNDYNDFAARLRVFSNPAHSRLTPVAHMKKLMPAVEHFDYCAWSIALPELSCCRTGYAALILLAWVFDRPKDKIIGVEVGKALLPLLTQFPLLVLATSRFPIMKLLGQVFESENVASFPSQSCRADLALHLHSVLDGASAFDPELATSVSEAMTVPRLQEGHRCAQQMLVTIVAIGRPDMLGEIGSILIDNTPLALEWLTPTPWPVWSALHTLWTFTQASASRTSVPLSMAMLPLSTIRRPDYSSIARRWARTDFNGWELPGTVLDEATSANAQDDGWISDMEKVLKDRLSDRAVLPKLRIAFLESQLPVFDDNMNFDYRAQQVKARNVLVPYDIFKKEWDFFIASPNLAVSRHGKVIGSFDKSTLGLIHAWNADFLAWPVHPTESDISTLNVYDLIIIMNEHPKGRPPSLPAVPGQIRLWQPWEPLIFTSNFTRILPFDYCPVVVDLFNVAAAPSVLMHHYYIVSDWQRALAPGREHITSQHQPEVFVFYSNPAHIKHLQMTLQRIGFHVSHVPDGAGMKEYWHVLQRASLAVLPPLRSMSRPSCGQAIADAAMANCVPTFSPRTKLFSRIIMPAFLSYRSPAELLAKIKMLWDNREWIVSLSQEVCRRLRYIDAANVETPLQFMNRVASQAPGDSRCDLRSGARTH